MREAFSRTGSRIWCDAHSVGVLLICAALIGRRAFLFAAACVAIASLLRSGARPETVKPEENTAVPDRLHTTMPETAFEPPAGAALPAVPDVSAVRNALERAVVGQAAALEALMIGLIAGGHVLLEGAPGLGKTLACRTIAQAIDATFSRIQCNADLTPADVAGCEIFDQSDRSFHFRLGPVFANVVLVDEINRAPARVQAALLEAMEEGHVTVGTQTRALADPFLVLATMNEAEADGIFPLPAAQLDRFLMRIVLDFPSAEEDLVILERRETGAAASRCVAATLQSVLSWRAACRAIYCAPQLRQYVVDIVRATRAAAKRGDLETGAGPRAGLAIVRSAGARAIVSGRNYVLPDDIRSIALAALVHRVSFVNSYSLGRAERETILRAIVDRVPAP